MAIKIVFFFWSKPHPLFDLFYPEERSFLLIDLVIILLRRNTIWKFCRAKAISFRSPSPFRGGSGHNFPREKKISNKKSCVDHGKVVPEKVRNCSIIPFLSFGTLTTCLSQFCYFFVALFLSKLSTKI